MCTFYHASNRNYTTEQEVSINDFVGDTTCDYERRTNEEKLVYDLLDGVRPNGVISREKCIYLFRELSLCQAYARSGHINHVYEVKCSDDNLWSPYPMTLVNTIFTCNNEERKVEIAQEYWSPTQRWNVCEYLASSFIVVQEIALNNNGITPDAFANDYVLSRRLYN